MKYPIAAPLFLAAAGACVLTGTLHPPLAPLAFGWGVPACFLSLNLVMVGASGGLSVPSMLLMTGSVLGLIGSACKAGFTTVPVCESVAALPPLVRPLLAFSGPALLVLRIGPEDPVLLSWLAASAVGIVPALPEHLQQLVWQPGFVSGVLILLCSAFMLRTRAADVALRTAHTLLTAVAACMLGPCIDHLMDRDQLAARVADLGAPFDARPAEWALAVCLAETLGTLLIVLRLAPRLGALSLLPKMAVATYGHALVDGFDGQFAAAYAKAYTPPGLSYNWSVGSSWECGFLGAGYFLLAYIALLLLPPLPAEAAPRSGRSDSKRKRA